MLVLLSIRLAVNSSVSLRLMQRTSGSLAAVANGLFDFDTLTSNFLRALVYSLQAAVDAALEGITGMKPTIHIVQLDMTSFESIRAGAAKINAQELPIDVSRPNLTFKSFGIHKILRQYRSLSRTSWYPKSRNFSAPPKVSSRRSAATISAHSYSYRSSSRDSGRLVQVLESSRFRVLLMHGLRSAGTTLTTSCARKNMVNSANSAMVDLDG